MVGPAFDDMPFEDESSKAPAKLTGSSKIGDDLESTMLQMLKSFRIEAMAEDIRQEDEISKRMREYVQSVENPNSVSVGTDCSIGIQSDFIPEFEPEAVPEQQPDPEPEPEEIFKEWDKEFGIDESDFRVAKRIEKWRDEANDRTYANVCEILAR